MAQDIGLFIGITIMFLFGSIVTFVIPRYIEKYDSAPDRVEDGRTMAKWMRRLGSVVIGVSIVFLIFALFFKAPEF